MRCNALFCSIENDSKNYCDEINKNFEIYKHTDK